MSKFGKETPRICATCPWRVANHGKPHPAGWYRVSNLRRLWNGLRTGKAPGMICHSTDPTSADYGGSEAIKPGHENECGGALYLIVRNMNAFSERAPQPFQPPLTKGAMRLWVERHLFGGGISVTPPDSLDDVGLPWMKPKVQKENTQ